jgi:photosystem II cytochrome c550
MTVSGSSFKQAFLLTLAAFLFIFQLAVSPASASELDAETRTLPVNAAGETVTLTQKQVIKGSRLFSATCGQCHLKGVTKTDPNVGLDPEALALATPPRDTIESLVDYLYNPTTYDGEEEISERHPSMKSTDIYPKMRNLTDEDLFEISAHILLQPKVMGNQWGTGKTKY